MIGTTFMTSAQGVYQTEICIHVQIDMLKITCWGSFFFIDSYFVSEMRVLADEEIFEIVNSTAANTGFYDTEKTPWAKLR